MRALLAGWLVAFAAAMCLVLAPAPVRADTGPPLETPEAELRAALECPDTFDHPAHEPLLLVHGTFTNGWEHWSWNWQPVLTGAGWDVCTVTLPDRSLNDMQIQAEYVVFAIREIATRSGASVDVMGHSQGALHPRWAVKWWPDAQAAIDDLVMLAGPNHGTGLAAAQSPQGCFASCWQMTPGSNYLSALNSGDETPGSVSYTSIYTMFDELVQPQVPQSTSALNGATNVLVQDVCPGRPVEHALMMADHAVHAIVMDALVNAGPADVSRLDQVATCAGVFFEGVDMTSHAPDIMRRSMEQGFPQYENHASEPPLKPYAQGGGSSQATASNGSPNAEAATVAGAESERLRAGEPTPATGGVPSLAAGAALITPAMIALWRRRAGA